MGLKVVLDVHEDNMSSLGRRASTCSVKSLRKMPVRSKNVLLGILCMGQDIYGGHGVCYGECVEKSNAWSHVMLGTAVRRLTESLILLTGSSDWSRRAFMKWR